MNKKIIITGLIISGLLVGCANSIPYDSDFLYRSANQGNFHYEEEHLITSYNIIEPINKGTLTWVQSTKPETPEPVITFTPIKTIKATKYLFFNTHMGYNDSSSFTVSPVTGLPDGDKITTTSEQQAGAMIGPALQLLAKAAAEGATEGELEITTEELKECQTLTDIIPPTPIDVLGFYIEGSNPGSYTRLSSF